MRCYICDYSYNTPSEFHKGIVGDSWGRMKIKHDKERNRHVCEACFHSASDALSEMINIDEEYVFNALEPKVKKRFELDKNSR